ncbi:MAG: PAS domain S-box protein, partial [Planctomycetaceae bacterium]|nr:PAS domain S-box protein [Planctomycetaceae bacterium]
WTKCLEDGNPREVSFRIRKADDTYRWHIARQVPICDSSGTITTWYGTCTDIEILKRTEASLQENELRWRLLFEGAADAIFWADAESGLLTQCNAAAEKMMGRDRSELIGQPQSILHPPEEADRYRQLFEEHVLTQPNTPVEVEVIRKDGRRIDVAISPSVTMINGKHVIQGIFRDITERKVAERTIQKLSRFRETIIQTAAEGICVCVPIVDFPYVAFTVWNDRMIAITGYTVGEINQRGWYQSLYPDSEVQLRAQQRMDRMRHGDDLKAEKWEIVRKDGERRIISISTSLIDFDEESAVAALIQDVTDQRKNVRSLKESERSLQFFRTLVNLTNDTIHVMDPSTSRFLDVNEQACTRLGYTHQEMLQLGAIDIEASLPTLAEWLQHVQDVKASGNMLLEGTHRCKDGTTFPVEVNVRHVTVDQQEYMVAVVRDITERQQTDAARQRAIEELRRSEERFSKLFHASPFSIIVASYPSGRIIEANDAFLRLFEFQRDEVIDRTTGELEIWVFPSDRQRMLDSLHSRGAAPNMEYEFRTKLGKTLSLVMSVEIIQLDGQDYSLAMSIDVSQLKAAQAELHRTDELLRAVVRSTTDAVFVKDRQGKYLLFNEAAGNFVGVPAVDVIGLDDHSLFEEEAVRIIQTHDRRVMESGIVHTAEETLTAAGVSRTYLSTKAPHRDKAGNVIAVIGISRDITDRKKSEQLIQENESRLRLLMDSIPAYISYVDVDERYLWVNQVYEDWYQRPRSEIIGRTIRELQGEENYAVIQPHVQRVLRGDSVHYEQELQSSSHHRMTFDTHYIPHRSEGGRVLGFFVMVFDLTAERSTQLALRESETRYRKLFETCGDAIFILDLQGNIRSVNPAAAAMHGYTTEELIGRNMRELDIPSDADQIPDRIQQVLAGQTLHFDVNHRRKNGEEFPISVVATLLQIGDEPLVLSFDRDITERKRNEEQRQLLAGHLAQAQKMEAIGRLAGGVAHDFNNILTVINGYSALLLNKTHPEDERSEMLREIAAAGARAATLTQQLLNYSRKQVIKRHALDLNSVVREMENMLRQLIGENIELSISCSNTTALVFADAGQVGQVVMNLAVNARDAMPAGGQLTMSIRTLDLDASFLQEYVDVSPGRFVQLTVADTGNGIPPDLMDRIFEPFFTTKGVGTGTGLGLASVRAIAEDSGGFVSVHSQPDQGSTFEFYLPAIDAESATPLVRTPEAAGGRETILIVEDEDAVRMVMHRFLEEFGYTVLTARGAAEAIAIAGQSAGKIDLLITDVVMPEKSGRDLVEGIQRRWPNLKYLYVSGYSTDDVVRHGVSQSHVAFLQKPFTPDGLARKLRELLDQP